MNLVLVALLLQSLVLPPRIAVENPASITAVPNKIKKDYDKLWARFLSGKEDRKVISDAEKLLKKQKDFEAPLMIEAYVNLYTGRYTEAERNLAGVVERQPQHRLALSYLAEISLAREDYAKASQFYSKLSANDQTRSDIEPKRQKALLLATDALLRNAAKAEEDNRLTEAEAMYRDALRIAPNEPVLYGELGQVLLKEKKWDDAIIQFRRQLELDGPSSDAQRHLAEGLMNLGRTEEARTILDKLRQSGSADDVLEARVKDLEDLGRWGGDIDQLRTIESSDILTREQLAAIVVRYFPQVTEFRQVPVIVTDTQNSWADLEIQTIVGIGLMDPFPNHTFQPSRIVSRGEFALAMSRLTRLLGLLPSSPPIPATDLIASNGLYPDIQLVLGLGIMTLDDAGNFNINATLSGQNAVTAAVRLFELLRQKTG